MEWIMDILSESILGILGVALTLLASRVGTVLGKFWREKMKDESIRSVATTCVFAVEQMYGGKSGREKLEKALILGEKLLAGKGIRISAQEMRVVLEAALSQAKGAFEKK